MRDVIHDTVIRFRANKALADPAQRLAEQRHMNISELLRQALRNELARPTSEAEKKGL